MTAARVEGQGHVRKRGEIVDSVCGLCVRALLRIGYLLLRGGIRHDMSAHGRKEGPLLRDSLRIT